MDRIDLPIFVQLFGMEKLHVAVWYSQSACTKFLMYSGDLMGLWGSLGISLADVWKTSFTMYTLLNSCRDTIFWILVSMYFKIFFEIFSFKTSDALSVLVQTGTMMGEEQELK